MPTFMQLSQRWRSRRPRFGGGAVGRASFRPAPVLTASLLVLAASQASAQQSCPTYVALAEAALPAAVGTPGLVATMVTGVGSTPQKALSAGFDPRALGRFTGDALKANPECSRNSLRRSNPSAFTCTYGARKDARTTLAVDLGRGEITYINPGRRFDPAGPDNLRTENEALDLAVAAGAALGIDTEQLDVAHGVARAVRMVTKEKASPDPVVPRRIEVVADLPRVVNGRPVADSGIRVVVDRDGRPARIHLRWPDFSIAPAAGFSPARSRADLVAEIAERFGELGDCDSFVSIKAHVAWVAGSVASPDEDANEVLPTPPPGRYVPSLRVSALPPGTAEDSGGVGGFIHDIDVALVQGTPAEDTD